MQQGGKERAGNTADSSNGKAIDSRQAAAIRKEIKRTGAKEKAVCYQYKIKSLSEMSQAQYKDAMDIFSGMKDRAEEKAVPERNAQMTVEEWERYFSERMD